MNSYCITLIDGRKGKTMVIEEEAESAEDALTFAKVNHINKFYEADGKPVYSIYNIKAKGKV